MISLKKAAKIIFNIRAYARERSELRDLISSQESEVISTNNDDIYGDEYKANRIFTNNRGTSYENYSSFDVIK